MNFNERYAKEKDKKEFWDKDDDPDGGHHSKLSPEQKAKAKARAKAHGRPYPNKVDNTWAAREASTKTANQYIKHQGGKWVILNKEGKVLSHHDSKDKAEAAFAAMMANKHKHGNIALDADDWRNEYFNLDSDW